MTNLGAYEAKTHFSSLLERVARGERFAITRHGVPVAYLVPASAEAGIPRGEAIDALQRFRVGRKASRRTLRRWIAEGRA
jgi:prevent-host-death family protein